MIPVPNLRTLLLSAAIALTAWMGLEACRAHTAEVTTEAHAREDHYRRLLLDVTNQATQAMSMVLDSDPYLHDRIRTELPRWRRTVAVVRAVTEVDE